MEGDLAVEGFDPAAAWLFGIITAGAEAGAADAGAGGTDVLCRHAAVPTSTRGRFLVPIDSRAAAVGSLRSFNRLRSWRSRLPRSALAAAIGAGVAMPLLRTRTSVTWRDTGAGDLADRWLIEHLRHVLGEDELVVAAGLRHGDTFAKPVLQLFRPDGAPVGYAKVGWNDVTIPRVRTEAAVLAGWPVGCSPDVAVPRLLHAGEWAGRFVSVTAPLPRRARRLGRRDASPALASAAVSRAWPTTTDELARSSYWASLRADATSCARGQASGAPALEALLDRLEVDVGTAELSFGRWHGDWVSWNLAVAEGRLWAWDWEYSDASVPVGLDVVHHLFQEDFVGRRQPAADALRSAGRGATELLTGLGLPPAAVRATVALHRAELLRRDAVAEAAGGHPDQRLDSDAVAAELS